MANRAASTGAGATKLISSGTSALATSLTFATPLKGSWISVPTFSFRLLQAIRETGGECITVDDEATLQAQEDLAKRGLYVEPTSATVVAALNIIIQKAAPHEIIVAPLTGSGLKGSNRA